MTPLQKDIFSFTERDMQRGFTSSWLNGTPRYDFIVPNAQMAHNEMDLICIRKSGFVDEIEIKLSRSDFKADFCKTARWLCDKHDQLANGELLPNYFSFYVPASIEEAIINLMPDHAGLFVFESGHATERIKAPRLHRDKVSDKIRLKLGRKIMYRYWREVR